MIFEIDELFRRENKEPRFITFELIDKVDELLKLKDMTKEQLIDKRNDLVKSYMGAVECLRCSYASDLDRDVSYKAIDKIIDDMNAVTSVIDRRLMNY